MLYYDFKLNNLRSHWPDFFKYNVYYFAFENKLFDENK